MHIKNKKYFIFNGFCKIGYRAMGSALTPSFEPRGCKWSNSNFLKKVRSLQKLAKFLFVIPSG